MRSVLYTLALTIFCLSCKKNSVEPGKTVEIYLLTNYQNIPGKCQVDAATAVLPDTATIENQDILTYSPSRYQLKLTATAIAKIKGMRDATAFAVTVDKQVIYFGFYKPVYSSSTCEHSITMDLDWVSNNKIVFKPGYPGPPSLFVIEDNRNNPKLIETLRSQRKIIQ
jgi:hypothetical protein